MNIVKEESFFERSVFIRSYTDFVVECKEKILVKEFMNVDKTSQVIIAKVQKVDDQILPEQR